MLSDPHESGFLEGNTFALGVEGGTVVKVEVFGWKFPEATDYWDGNWLHARAFVEVPGFRADFPLFVRSEEIAGFLEDLKPLDANLRGEAEFRTLEGQLRLNLKVTDGLGHIGVEVEAQYPVGTGARLGFDLEIDQTFLPSLIRGVAEVASNFPVRGAPREAPG